MFRVSEAGCDEGGDAVAGVIENYSSSLVWLARDVNEDANEYVDR